MRAHVGWSVAPAFILLGLVASSAHAQLCGDADGNGNVTVSDGVQVLRRAAGLSSVCTDAACDFDGNGEVSVSDGVNVLREAAGLAVVRNCPAADPFIETVERSDGRFGELTKIALISPVGAPATISIEPPSEVLSGSKISFTVNYAVDAGAAGTDGGASLLVASRSDGSPPTGSSFRVPLEGDDDRATVHVGLRDGVQTSRIDFATAANDAVTGEVVSVVIIVVPNPVPTCGNRIFDGGEECEPPGSLCAVGFCDDTCACRIATGPTATPTPQPCGDGIRQGAEQCDGDDALNCEAPLACRTDGSCKCETPSCPNGVREGSEQCDGGDAAACQGRACLVSCACATPPPNPTATPTPPPGTRFVDNGETVTDTLTGLEWEKKEAGANGQPDLSNPHDVDNRYKWTDLDTEFLAELNDPPCFANHCDWRLPTVERDGDPKELETIIDLSTPGCGPQACVPAVFGPTDDTRYWSGTTRAADSADAYHVNVTNGVVDFGFKSNSRAVRAVRGGS